MPFIVRLDHRTAANKYNLAHSNWCILKFLQVFQKGI